MNAPEISLLVITVLALGFILKWHLDPSTKLNFSSVITDEKGEFSLFRTGQATALVISTWYFVTEVIRNQMTWEVFALYMSTWAGANLIKMGISKMSVKGDTNATQ